MLIVILNYRTVEVTVDCLRSISRVLDEVQGTRVVVMDNGSGDGSVERIERAMASNSWGGWCELVALPENVGFAAGSNRGMERLKSTCPDCEWVLLLNSDTIVQPGAQHAFTSPSNASEERANHEYRLSGVIITPIIVIITLFPTGFCWGDQWLMLVAAY